jgi:DNA ligase-1
MSTKPVAHQVVPGEAGAESATASRGAARPRESWFHLCGTADAIRQASKPDEKRSLLEPYLVALDAHTIGPAARIFAGVSRPDGDATPLTISRTLTVGVIRSLTRASAERLLELTMKLGDLGDAAGEVFSGRLPSGLAVVEVEEWLRTLAAAETDEARLPLLRDMLAKLSGIEALYVVRITDGGLHVGLDQSLVEEAIANAFHEPVDLVRDAVGRHHDIGIVAERARRHVLTA